MIYDNNLRILKCLSLSKRWTAAKSRIDAIPFLPHNQRITKDEDENAKKICAPTNSF